MRWEASGLAARERSYWAVCFVNNTGGAARLAPDQLQRRAVAGRRRAASRRADDLQYQVVNAGVITDATRRRPDGPTVAVSGFHQPDIPNTASRCRTRRQRGGQQNGDLPTSRSRSTSVRNLAALARPQRRRERPRPGGRRFLADPAGVVTPILNINDVTLTEGDAGTTTFTFTVSLTAPAGAGGVTFDIATADGTAQDDNPAHRGQRLRRPDPDRPDDPDGLDSTLHFNVTVNGDTAPEPNETFFVNVTNVTGANVGDGQGQGTILNDDVATFHPRRPGQRRRDADPGRHGRRSRASSSATSRRPTQLPGFFLQEEDADADADPATSEGIFVFCSACPTPVAEGQRVRVTGIGLRVLQHDRDHGDAPPARWWSPTPATTSPR